MDATTDGRHPELLVRLPRREPADRYRLAAAAARSQHSVITTRQLVAAGWPRSAIAVAARDGRLEDLGTGVWGMPGSRRTWQRRLAAAIYGIGTPVAAARTTALALHGVRRFRRNGPIHLVVPYRRSVARSSPDVRVHRSRTFGPEDVTLIDGLPVTGIARSVCVTAAGMAPGAVRWLLSEVLRAGTTDLAHLRGALGRLGPIPGLRIVRQQLERLDPQVARARSGGEVSLLGLAREAGVPDPVLNHRIEDDEGRTLFEVDVACVALRLGFEHDGEAFHTTPDELLKDRHRDNRLALDLDWDIYRFSERLVRDHPRIVVRQMREAVERASRRRRDDALPERP